MPNYQGPLPVVPNIFKVTLNWTEAGALHYGSHFYMHYTGGPISQADLQTVANKIASQWPLGIKENWGSDIVLSTILCRDLSSRTGFQATAVSGTAGNATGATTEAGTAVRLRFIIAYYYRGGHPGIYLPPSTVTFVQEPASWTTAFQNQVVSDWNGLIASLVGLSLASVSAIGQYTVSYYSGPFPNPNQSEWAKRNVPKYRPTPQTYPVTSVVCMPLIAAQRRRRQATGA